jgi:hypothetical protein
MRSEEEIKKEVILAQARLTSLEELMSILKSSQEKEVISSARLYYRAKVKWLRWVLEKSE